MLPVALARSVHGGRGRFFSKALEYMEDFMATTDFSAIGAAFKRRYSNYYGFRARNFLVDVSFVFRSERTYA